MLSANRFTLGLALLALAPPLWSDAVAGVPTQDPPSVTVRYHDLNLNSPQGVTVLYQRIRGAASEVCHSFEGREPLRRQLLQNDCFAGAVANAVRTVHNEALSAYHWQQVRGHRTHEGDVPTSVARR